MYGRNILEMDYGDPIVITGQSALAPTGSSPEEIFENQLLGAANNKLVNPLEFSSIEALKKELTKNKKDHPILRNGMSDDEANNAIMELLELGGCLPSKINGAVSHNGIVLQDADFVSIIEKELEKNSFSDEYSSVLLNNVKKGKFDPSILHSVYMSLVAAKQAGILGSNGLIDTNTSINLGHGYAGLRNVERDGMMGGLFTGNKLAMGPKHLVGSLPNMPAPIVANALSSNAGATVDDQACASAGYAIERAVLQILSGKTNTAIAGGTDAVSDSLYAITSFGRMGALAKGYSENPNDGSRPFSKALNEETTKGFVLGDGGGISVLELQSNAESRGVASLAEICGIGSSTCNPMHVEGAGLSSGTSEGQSLSMNNALMSASITANEFNEQGGIIFAHGTSTQMGDITEAKSISNVFGNKAQVTGLKGVLGHALGGSAAQAISIGISSFANNIIPGTINYSDENRIEGMVDINVISENKERQVKYILINAFGFGGHNISLLLKNPGS